MQVFYSSQDESDGDESDVEDAKEHHDKDDDKDEEGSHHVYPNILFHNLLLLFDLLFSLLIWCTSEKKK